MWNWWKIQMQHAMKELATHDWMNELNHESISPTHRFGFHIFRIRIYSYYVQNITNANCESRRWTWSQRTVNNVHWWAAILVAALFETCVGYLPSHLSFLSLSKLDCFRVTSNRYKRRPTMLPLHRSLPYRQHIVTLPLNQSRIPRWSYAVQYRRTIVIEDVFQQVPVCTRLLLSNHFTHHLLVWFSEQWNLLMSMSTRGYPWWHCHRNVHTCLTPEITPCRSENGMRTTIFARRGMCTKHHHHHQIGDHQIRHQLQNFKEPYLISPNMKI